MKSNFTLGQTKNSPAAGRQLKLGESSEILEIIFVTFDGKNSPLGFWAQESSLRCTSYFFLRKLSTSLFIIIKIQKNNQCLTIGNGLNNYVSMY